MPVTFSESRRNVTALQHSEVKLCTFSVYEMSSGSSPPSPWTPKCGERQIAVDCAVGQPRIDIDANGASAERSSQALVTQTSVPGVVSHAPHSPGTSPTRSFPQLNLHRARVHRNRQRPRANGFTGPAQNSPPAFTPQGQRASGKALTLTRTLVTN